MTTPSSTSSQSGSQPLEEFIEGVCSSDPFKVEEDLGSGYVKLRSTEAEKRQAAQDIKCVEDIVIELLRNSRDAGASHIYLATTKEGGQRTLIMIDDGCGIPASLWEAVFQPRVTSKLDTAHMDKWGMHGRGMALYSTRVNVSEAKVIASEKDAGCAIRVDVGSSLPEKTDQSTFPRFEEADGIMAMRGPKNILRISCEFALEHRDIKVHVGTPAQITAALYQYGLATVPAYTRAFGEASALPLIKALGLSSTPEDLAARASCLGLEISLRTARRIIDGQSEGADDLISHMQHESFPKIKPNKRMKGASIKQPHARRPHISVDDRDRFLQRIKDAYADIADAYYLEGDIIPELHVKEGSMVVEIPLLGQERPDEGASRI